MPSDTAAPSSAFRNAYLLGIIAALAEQLERLVEQSLLIIHNRIIYRSV